MDDPLHAVFKHAAGDNTAITTGHQWSVFTTELRELGLVTETHEIRFLDGIWAEEVSKGQWVHGREGGPSISFETIREKIFAMFGGLLNGGAEISSNLLQIEEEVNVLVQLVEGWDVSKLDEEQTRQLLTMLHALEDSFSKQNAQTQQLLERQGALIDANQVRELVHNGLGATTPSSSNPQVWQREHLPVIEAHLQKRRLRKLRPAPAQRSLPDTFGLLCGPSGHCSHVIGTRSNKDSKEHGGSTSVDVHALSVVVPRTAATLPHAWRAYDAHKQLALSPHWLGVHGVDESNADSVNFTYEYAQSTSVASLVARARSSHRNVSISEASPLFQHWVVSLLGALDDFDQQSCYSFGATASLRNVLISNDGLGVRLGNFSFVPLNDASGASEAVVQRSAHLLRIFADFVDDIALSFRGSASTTTTFDARPVKKVHESEAYAGIYLRPGERFELVLDSPSRHEDRWHFPEVQTLSSVDGSAPVELAFGDSLHVAPEGANQQCHIAMEALTPGRSNLHFYCFSRRHSRPTRPSLTIPVVVQSAEMSPPLKAILRCCRAPSRSGALPVTLEHLRTHSYFTESPPDPEDILASYYSCFT
jgi:hypothetical protein